MDIEPKPCIPGSQNIDKTALSLGDRLRNGIEEDILAGRLVPGDRLDERALAERYNVSRTPVREALRQLSTIGLVSVQLRQGARVAAIEMPRLLQMIEMMAVVEAEASRLAARRMSRGDRQRLLEIHAQAASAVQANDVTRFNAINWQLHLAIFAGSKNDFLANEARNLRLRVHLYRCYLMRVSDGQTIAHAQHEAMVQAIVNGNPEVAFLETRNHLALDSERMADLLALMPRNVRGDGPAQPDADEPLHAALVVADHPKDFPG